MPGNRYSTSPTLTLPAIQTGHAAIHQHHGFGAALAAEHGFFGEGLAFGHAVQCMEFWAFREH